MLQKSCVAAPSVVLERVHDKYITALLWSGGQDAWALNELPSGREKPGKASKKCLEERYFSLTNWHLGAFQ